MINLKKEGIELKQNIEIECFFELSNLYYLKKYKVLFISDNNEHKLIIIDSTNLKSHIMPLDLKLNSGIDKETITNVKYYDYDFDSFNELIITTNKGNIYFIDFNESSSHSVFSSELSEIDIVVDLIKNYKIEKYNAFETLSKRIEDIWTKKNNKTANTDSEQKALLELLTRLQEKINPNINCFNIIFQKIIDEQKISFAIGIDNYLFFIKKDKESNSIELINRIIKFETKIKNIIGNEVILIESENKKYLAEINKFYESLKIDIAIETNDDKIIEQFLFNKFSDESILSLSKINENIIITTDKSISTMNKQDIKWTVKTNGTITSEPLIDDIDNNGILEIIIATKAGEILNIRIDGSFAWKYYNNLWNTNTPCIILKGKQKIIANSAFNGKIELFYSQGIIDMNIEPSSAIMLDYGSYDVEYNSNNYLKGDLIKEITINENIINNYNINDSNIAVLTTKGNIYFIGH